METTARLCGLMLFGFIISMCVQWWLVGCVTGICVYWCIETYLKPKHDERTKSKPKRQKNRGCLAPNDRNIIQSNYIDLLDSIQPESLRQALFSNGVLDEEDVEHIKKMEGKTRKDVTREILRILQTSGESSFITFVKCLEETGHHELAAKLKNCDNEQTDDTCGPVIDELKHTASHIHSEDVGRPRDRGKMPDFQYKILQTHYMVLLDNIQPDILKDSLYAKRAFDDDDIENINKIKENGRRNTCKELIKIVLQCGEGAFDKFVHCLEETGHTRIAEQLRKEPVENRTPPTTKTQSRKRMPAVDKIVGENRNILIESIDPDKLLEGLFQTALFDMNDQEEVANFGGRKAKSAKILDILTKKSGDVLLTFIESLELTGHHHLTGHLTSVVDTPKPNSEDLHGASGDTPLSYTNIDYDSTPFPLHTASRDCTDMNVFKSFVDKYITHVNIIDNEGITALLEASRSQYHPVDKLTYLKSIVADMFIKDTYGRNALIYACKLGLLETVKYLVESGFDVNPTEGEIPLLYCCRSYITPVDKLKYLQSIGADMFIKDKDGNNALIYACKLGLLETVKYLVEFGFDVNPTEGEIPLLACSFSKRNPIDKIHYLRSIGADMFIKDKYGRNALIYACKLGLLETVKYLVELGFDVNPTEGEKPLLYCCRSYITPVDKLKCLISAGARYTSNDIKLYISESVEQETREFVESIMTT